MLKTEEEKRERRNGCKCSRSVEERFSLHTGLGTGSTTILGEIDGPGIIQHIWITVTDRTEKDYHVLRDLILRIYWDDEESPSVESPLGDFSVADLLEHVK